MRASILTILLSLVVIAGCDKIEAVATGEKITPTRDDKTFTMTVESIPESRIVEHCSTLGVKYEADGCAAFNSATKHCTIYVVDPFFVNDKERFSIIGHETWHCRFGEFHK